MGTLVQAFIPTIHHPYHTEATNNVHTRGRNTRTTPFVWRHTKKNINLLEINNVGTYSRYLINNILFLDQPPTSFRLRIVCVLLFLSTYGSSVMQSVVVTVAELTSSSYRRPTDRIIGKRLYVLLVIPATQKQKQRDTGDLTL